MRLNDFGQFIVLRLLVPRLSKFNLIYFLLTWLLNSSCIRMGERCITRPEEVNPLVRLSTRSKRFSSFRRIMPLSPVITRYEIKD